jgi:hypothetical protein
MSCGRILALLSPARNACYSVTVSPRHAVLAALGALVLLAGVYLFHEVRSTPANAAAPAAPDRGKSPDLRPEHAESGAPAPEPEHVADPGGPHHAPPPVAHPAMTSDPPPTVSGDDTPEAANPKIEAVMDQANKAYDRSDFEEAKMIAGKVLAKAPTNIRMMRIMVSASCIDGDNAIAQKWYEQLPKPDREQMKVRCDKYGVTFKEPAQ